jgi:prophage regulatory protein
MTAQPAVRPVVSPRLLRLPAVLDRVGLGRSRVYDLVKDGKFPAPVHLSARAIAWVESEVDSWCQDRVNERDAEAPR